MLKFHDISRAGTVSIFLWNKSTSLNGLIFHMHVSDDDSNKFCKFYEIWWLLKKCWNLIIFLGPALSVFFCEKNLLLWKGSNFTCMFLMMIPIRSASFMKFDEILKNVEISWYFKGPALSAFFYEISQLLRMGSNFTCMFLMMIQICFASLIKDGELWKKCWNFMIFLGWALSAFFYEISKTSLNGLIFHMHVSDDDSNKFCKFDEIWWLLKKCWNFMIFQRAGTVGIFLMK